MALNPHFLVTVTTTFISVSREDEGERVGLANSACLFLRAELGRAVVAEGAAVPGKPNPRATTPQR